MTARFLALGDSYTIGEGVPADDAWPAQLVRLVRQRGVGMADPRIIARTGWTTGDLASAIASEAPRPGWDLVSLLIGVNDQYAGVPVAGYEPAFMGLLETAINLAGSLTSRVLVLSIPDWGVTPFAAARGRDPDRVAREIAAFNSVNRAAAAARNVAYVDVTPSSRDVARDGGLLVADGLHPSARLYGEWARLALPGPLAALGGARGSA